MTLGANVLDGPTEAGQYILGRVSEEVLALDGLLDRPR
jgi:hypothetical protein